ncbi:hypothetical protein AB0M22_09090 [Nocardia sp. NPDC051756]|uniref:hypothetical protein n=1 Tax=Nocardia sp. NPDC051756 TaxID=3154751 RepID=UPI00343AA536
MTDQSELIAAVGNLTESVGALSTRLDTHEGLLTRIEEQRKETDAQRKGLNTTRIAVGFMGLVLIAGGFLYRQVDTNTRDVREVQQRTSTEILCPLYQFLALSLKANPPSPVASAEQVKLRETAANTITAGLDKLGCI